MTAGPNGVKMPMPAKYPKIFPQISKSLIYSHALGWPFSTTKFSGQLKLQFGTNFPLLLIRLLVLVPKNRETVCYPFICDKW
jgi:hypothetical protein